MDKSCITIGHSIIGMFPVTSRVNVKLMSGARSLSTMKMSDCIREDSEDYLIPDHKTKAGAAGVTDELSGLLSCVDSAVGMLPLSVMNVTNIEVE